MYLLQLQVNEGLPSTWTMIPGHPQSHFEILMSHLTQLASYTKGRRNRKQEITQGYVSAGLKCRYNATSIKMIFKST